MNRLRQAGALVTGGAIMAAIAMLSHAPWRVHAEPNGALRLSLSARPERFERCRTPTEEELASRPPHMRRPVICEGEAARYHLVVRRNDATILSRELTGGGARRDRPIHFLQEFPLAPGPHHLSISLSRLDSAPAGDSVAAGTAAVTRSTEVLPAELALDTTLTIAPHRVVLVTYDPRQRQLLALTAPREP